MIKIKSFMPSQSSQIDGQLFSLRDSADNFLLMNHTFWKWIISLLIKCHRNMPPPSRYLIHTFLRSLRICVDSDDNKPVGVLAQTECSGLLTTNGEWQHVTFTYTENQLPDKVCEFLRAFAIYFSYFLPLPFRLFWVRFTWLRIAPTNGTSYWNTPCRRAANLLYRWKRSRIPSHCLWGIGSGLGLSSSSISCAVSSTL